MSYCTHACTGKTSSNGVLYTHRVPPRNWIVLPLGATVNASLSSFHYRQALPVGTMRTEFVTFARVCCR